MTKSSMTRKRDRTMIQMERDHNIIVAAFGHDKELDVNLEEFNEYCTTYRVRHKNTFGNKNVYFHMCRYLEEYWFSMIVRYKQPDNEPVFVKIANVEQMVELVKYIVNISKC